MFWPSFLLLSSSTFFCLSLFLTADVRGPFEGYPQPVRFNTYGVIIFHNRNNII